MTEFFTFFVSLKPNYAELLKSINFLLLSCQSLSFSLCVEMRSEIIGLWSCHTSGASRASVTVL